MTKQCGTDKNSLLLPPVIFPDLPSLPAPGNYKVFSDENGVIYVLDSSGVATAVSPTGIDGSGGLPGQYWVTNGVSASWGDLPDFQGAIVVKADGTGDFTTVFSAIQSTESIVDAGYAVHVIDVYGEVTDGVPYSAALIPDHRCYIIRLQPGCLWRISSGLSNLMALLVIMGTSKNNPPVVAGVATFQQYPGQLRIDSTIAFYVPNLVLQNVTAMRTQTDKTTASINALKLRIDGCMIRDININSGVYATAEDVYIQYSIIERQVTIKPTITNLNIMYSRIGTFTSSGGNLVMNQSQGNKFCFNSFQALTNITINAGNFSNLVNGLTNPVP